MLFNHLKFAWRNLRKRFSYSFINIAGLAIGIASVLLIFLYAKHELSFDEYHQKKDRIYRIVDYGGFDDKNWSSIVEGDLVPEMRDNYTDVEDAVTITRYCGNEFSINGTEVENINPKCSEPSLFNIFTFELLQGDPQTVLDQPHTVVLTQSLANRLFPESDPMGQTITIGGIGLGEETLYTVTGVMEDIPDNTHFRTNIFISLSSMQEAYRDQAHYRYVLLEEGADPEAIADRALDRMLNVLGKGQETDDVALQPLSEIHFSSIYAERRGDINYLYILSAIALVILILACGNYLNLATAKYMKRSKEIGIRKVLGAHRSQLVKQFFLETVLLSLIALPFAIYLVYLTIPWFNSYVGTELTLGVAGNLWFYLVLTGIIGFTGLLAGSYPALVVSAFKPTEALSKNQTVSFSASGLRKSLVTFQFLASIAMIGITVVILQQLRYAQNQNLGFDSDHLVRITLADPAVRPQAQTLKQEFLQNVTVSDATLGAAPGTIGFAGAGFAIRPNPDDPDETMTLRSALIDPDYLSALDIPLLAGRNLTSESSGDQVEALVNRQAVREMGLPDLDQVLGKTIFGRYRIVGVVGDFHIRSLKSEIEPVLLYYGGQRLGGGITLRLEGGSIREGLEDIRNTWEAAGATTPLQYSFVDDQLQNLYEQEQQTAKVIGMFAGLSILIACMGLFGLAAYMVEQRFREIGIRKVMGAGVKDIVFLLYRDFGILIGIAALLSIPVIYIAGSRWLENFAYRMEIGPSIFLISILAVMLLSMLATGSRSLRAALMNPVDAIRDE